MRKFLVFYLACVWLFPFSAMSCDKHSNHEKIESIEKYEIVISDELKKKIKTGKPGVGSGLTFKGMEADGSYLFYSITDRGINFDNANLEDGSKATMFAEPDFKPFVSEIKLRPGKGAEVVSAKDFNLTGLPPKTNKSMTPISANLDILNFDPHGIDSEAVDIDKQGNFWIADEYRPAVLQFSPDGRKLKQIDIGEILPDIRDFKMNNRGIESLAITPNGKLVFALESILNLEGKTKNTAEFIRVVELDLETKQFKVFAYALDHDKYSDRANVKIGDIAAIDDNNFLFVEQGLEKSGQFVNDIYLVSTKNATDISRLRKKGEKEFEFGPINGLIEFPLRKSPLLAMREHNWPHEKLEGIAYIDNKTIALVNDNDFGMIPEFMGKRGEAIDKYQLNTKEKTISDGITTEKFDLKFHDDPNKNSEIWLIKLTSPIKCE